MKYLKVILNTQKNYPITYLKYKMYGFIDPLINTFQQLHSQIMRNKSTKPNGLHYIKSSKYPTSMRTDTNPHTHSFNFISNTLHKSKRPVVRQPNRVNHIRWDARAVRNHQIIRYYSTPRASRIRCVGTRD